MPLSMLNKVLKLLMCLIEKMLALQTTLKINLLFRYELLRTSRYFYHISCCCMNNK